MLSLSEVKWNLLEILFCSEPLVPSSRKFIKFMSKYISQIWPLDGRPNHENGLKIKMLYAFFLTIFGCDTIVWCCVF